jgi:hypothetical protein
MLERNVTDSVRTYEIERSFIVLTHVGIWLFAAMAVLSIFLSVMEDQPRLNAFGFYAVCAAMFAGFVGFSAASYCALRKARFSAVATDKHGLWNVHAGKEKGLVRWESVKSVRERAFGQRLELIGYAGERLLDIEYQLRGFDELRSILLSKLPESDRPYPQRYQRKTIYVPFQFAFTLLVLTGIWWCISVGQILLGVGLLAVLFFGIREFLTSVTAITIWRDRLEIEFPWRKAEIRPTDIKAVLFADVHNEGARVPQLALQLTSGKVIKLQGLGIAEAELYRHLSVLSPAPA